MGFGDSFFPLCIHPVVTEHLLCATRCLGTGDAVGKRGWGPRGAAILMGMADNKCPERFVRNCQVPRKMWLRKGEGIAEPLRQECARCV